MRLNHFYLPKADVSEPPVVLETSRWLLLREVPRNEAEGLSKNQLQPKQSLRVRWCLRVYRCRRKSLPPRGRGTALAVEGACVTLGLDTSYCIALSLSRLAKMGLNQ